jgi:hypothetical protein
MHGDFVMMNQYFGSWHGSKDGLPIALDVAHASWPDKPVIVSEYGYSARWEEVSGPVLLDPAQYYVVPDDAPVTSDGFDGQRCRVIADQVDVFRSRPFVAGAIFWVYQDYRSLCGFVMGVVDAQRNRRGSWHVLREAYAPLLVESVEFSGPSGGTCRAAITLRARGPVDEDIPAYTLREYRLCWEVARREDGKVAAEGALVLPTLEPGARWLGEVAWDEPGDEVVFTLSVARPLGHTVVERSYVSDSRPAEDTGESPAS